MSNIKNAKRMDVVVGRDVEHVDMLVYGMGHMGEDAQFPVDVTWNEQHYMVIDIDEDLTDPDMISKALEGLQEYADKTNPNDWLQPQGDYNTGDDTWLVIEFGTYYSDEVVIGVHVLEYA